MKTLNLFFGVGITVALLGLNVAMADLRNDSARKPLTFSLDIGDDSVILPDISFDSIRGDEEALSTCAMTPGGSASSLLNPPLIMLPRPEQWSHPSRMALAPLGTLPPTRSDSSNRRRRTPPTTTTYIPEEPPPIVVPEPATLLIVGLGIGAVAAVRRREESKKCGF